MRRFREQTEPRSSSFSRQLEGRRKKKEEERKGSFLYKRKGIRIFFSFSPLFFHSFSRPSCSCALFSLFFRWFDLDAVCCVALVIRLVGAHCPLSPPPLVLLMMLLLNDNTTFFWFFSPFPSFSSSSSIFFFSPSVSFAFPYLSIYQTGRRSASTFWASSDFLHDGSSCSCAFSLFFHLLSYLHSLAVWSALIIVISIHFVPCRS